MASMKKYARTAVPAMFRHNSRLNATFSNLDIDPSRSHLNYDLVDHGMSALDYYNERMSQLYCYNRADVKTLVGWVITAPSSLPEDRHDAFFEASVDFLGERYGAENLCQAVVHKDEAGQDHVHCLLIPVTPKKDGGEKVCANDVITRQDLRTFHRDLEEYLHDHGIDAEVRTGITAAQGGNRTVKQLKKERDQQLEQEREMNEKPESKTKGEDFEVSPKEDKVKPFRLEDYVPAAWCPREREQDDERDHI